MVKLNRDSILFNERVSAEIITNDNKYGVEKGELSIWINGGSAYELDIDIEVARKLQEMNYKVRDEIASKIAERISEVVELEIKRLEKELKD